MIMMKFTKHDASRIITSENIQGFMIEEISLKPFEVILTTSIFDSVFFRRCGYFY